MPAPWVPQVRGITDTSMFDPYDTEDHPETGKQHPSHIKSMLMICS
jgi:hypothetical protein